MPRFSQSSLVHLQTLHADLRVVMLDVIEHYDFRILEGHRSTTLQGKAFAQGKSKVRFGKHNVLPSLAVDIAPWPVDWQDRGRFAVLAGFVLLAARLRGIELRWGGDWDRDGRTLDNKFDDLVHFELVGDQYRSPPHQKTGLGRPAVAALMAGAADERDAVPAPLSAPPQEPDMETNKKWYLSKTIWGGVLALGAGVFNLTGDDVTQLTSLLERAAGHVMALASIAGGLLAIYGRLKANAKIG
jgi:peptidoglycan LD-endopeptidase CwlK